uniref:sprouty-related, EVH1 domain-containing protein 3 n=1 Tax=Pristiophorus japonicus TaxID=55135 RepID=UPI00398F1347
MDLPPPPLPGPPDLSLPYGNVSFSDSYVVRVRAVVMTRDDSSGGWVPLGGAGLSQVMICKVARSEGSSRGGFLIRGERLRDQAMILECGLKRDLIYNKVNPIFHHWKVDDDKFGLTFQSPADAVTFERSIQTAIEEMAEGSLTSSSSSQGEVDAVEDIAAMHTDSESSSNSRKEMLPKHITIVTSESSSSCYITSPASDEFRLGQTQVSVHPNQLTTRPALHGSFGDEDELESANPCKDLWVAKGYEDYRRAVVRERDANKIDLCVHFAKGEPREGGGRGEGGGSPGTECPLKEARGSPGCRASPSSPGLLKKAAKEAAGGVGAGGGGGSGGGAEEEEDSRCVYCRDVFRDRENGRGRCQDAPDPIGRCVHQASCMWCAESMLYHCMSDSEGDYSDPCSCDASSRHFCARWLALAALSLMAPCMCCYLPLRACHRCGERWGCCGGKHKAVR